MKPIAERAIWLENLSELLIRWYDKQPTDIQVQAVSPHDAAIRVKKRAHRVIEFSGIEEAKPIKNSREWETRWEPKKLWKRLADAMDKLDHDAFIQDEHPTGASVRLNALHESDRESVVLVRSTLEEVKNRCTELGLTLELTIIDIAVYQLALEYFYLQTPRMGNLPRPWVDEIAAHYFAQQILGVPFNLYLLHLVKE